MTAMGPDIWRKLRRQPLYPTMRGEMDLVREADNGYRSGGRQEMLRSILRVQKTIV